ncbi:MAG TPA: response regulator transcription factor [Verrucomicrobiota bacterium]|nr:response regulator transcription factor [Verrucomicrobiota bacterium]
MNSQTAPGETSRNRILVVEDNPVMAAHLAKLVADGGKRDVQIEDSGLAAVERIVGERPDLVILDLGLPDIDGMDVLRQVRPCCDVPIIILTGRIMPGEEAKGLTDGAEDFIFKPFDPAVLMARVEARLRSSRAAALAIGAKVDLDLLVVGPLRLDTTSREASLAGDRLVLTGAEFVLLAALARRPGEVVPKAELIEVLREAGLDPSTRSLDVLVLQLRKKLGDSARSPRWLRTVHGRGLVLAPPAS